jgi:branched-chain amino acid transport system ATP-binding protein
MLLELAGLNKRFGAVVAADEVDLAVADGDALGIIGANGAGKTSLFNLITGVLKPDSGEVRLDRRDITAMKVRERCKAGIGRTFQVPRPFESLSVFENLLVAAQFGRWEHGGADECAELLRRTALLAKANVIAGKLTLLDRKRLELARALATRPRLLLLDEIAGGLTESECGELVTLIRDIHGEGVTIIWIEHIVHALFSVVSRLVVLEFGRKIAEGAPAEVMARPEVQRSYLGIEEEVA